MTCTLIECEPSTHNNGTAGKGNTAIVKVLSLKHVMCWYKSQNNDTTHKFSSRKYSFK